MAWLSIRLYAEARTTEAIADALIEAGALSVSCDDADAGTPDEAAQFAEPGMPPAQPWRRNLLTALVEANADPQSIVAQAASACAIAPPSFETSIVEDEDWVRRTQVQFEPIRITDCLWVVPSWCEPPDRSAVNISIDPGLAFGTGSHPTTRLCLRWLEEHLAAGSSVIDYGCGSGVLAIAAKLLGAGPVTGVDIDPQAIVASRANAAMYGVAARFEEPERFAPEPADVVVANILSNPLRMLAPLICGLARSGGAVVLSGILAAQRELVSDAYRPWLALEPAQEEEGWVCVWGIKR